ncbi:polysaccharide biosynthesis C-terminal domain-containing protein [Cryomorphaceae bacterium]|nr:polysaccharide biosynthesis C-terminal domain-containing protein [Cryomorphaceae bacterium]
MSKIPISGLAFAHSVLITRLLGPEGFGVFQFITTNVQFLVMAIGFNMTNGIMYFTASQRIAQSKIFSMMVLIFLVFFTLLTSLLFGWSLSGGIGPLILPEGFQKTPFAIYFLAAFLYHFAQVFMHAHLKGQKNFIRSNNLLMLSGVLNVAVSGSLYLLVAGGFDANIALLFQALTGLQLALLIVTFCGYYTKARPQWNLSWSRSELKTYFGYTSLGYGNMFSKFFNKRLDVYFVQFISGSTALGHYGVATSLTNFLLDFVQPLNQVVLPYLTTMNEEETEKTYPVYLRVFTGILLIPAIILLVLADPLVNLIYGSAFGPAAAALKIMAIAVVFAYVRNYFSSYNNAKDRVRFNLMANISALVITVVLDLLLIPKLGILGAAYATLCAYGLSCVMIGVTVKRHMDIPWSTLLLPKRSDWKTLRELIGKLG